MKTKNFGLIQQIRAFNRLYTSRLGILNSEVLDSGLSLPEGRIIYEIGNGTAFARELNKALGMDEGYLSRILLKLEKQGIISRRTDPSDQRKRSLALSAKGRKILEELNAKADRQIEEMLSGLDSQAAKKLKEALISLEEVFGGMA